MRQSSCCPGGRACKAPVSLMPPRTAQHFDPAPSIGNRIVSADGLALFVRLLRPSRVPMHCAIVFVHDAGAHAELYQDAFALLTGYAHAVNTTHHHHHRHRYRYRQRQYRCHSPSRRITAVTMGIVAVSSVTAARPVTIVIGVFRISRLRAQPCADRRCSCRLTMCLFSCSSMPFCSLSPAARLGPAFSASLPSHSPSWALAVCGSPAQPYHSCAIVRRCALQLQLLLHVLTAARVPVAADSRAGCAVIALDLRGHGRSQGPRFHVDHFDEYAADVLTAAAHMRGQIGSELPSALHDSCCCCTNCGH